MVGSLSLWPWLHPGWGKERSSTQELIAIQEKLYRKSQKIIKVKAQLLCETPFFFSCITFFAITHQAKHFK